MKKCSIFWGMMWKTCYMLTKLWKSNYFLRFWRKAILEFPKFWENRWFVRRFWGKVSARYTTLYAIAINISSLFLIWVLSHCTPGQEAVEAILPAHCAIQYLGGSGWHEGEAKIVKHNVWDFVPPGPPLGRRGSSLAYLIRSGFRRVRLSAQPEISSQKRH